MAEIGHHGRRSYSLNVVQNIKDGLPETRLIPHPYNVSRTTSRFGSFQSTNFNKTTTESSCDPLDFLIPITNGCLVLMAVIFVIALGIVAMVILMAIYKNGFHE